MNPVKPRRLANNQLLILAMAFSAGLVLFATSGCVVPDGSETVNDNTGNDDPANDNADNDNADNGNANNDNSGEDNSNDNVDDNPNDNDNSDDPPTDPGLLATSQRLAFQSQCAQNVLECTTIWPQAVATLDLSRLGADQAFSILSGGGFVVTGSDSDGSEIVPVQGDQSVLGDEANTLTYSWSHAATDSDACTLESGPVFSTDPNPLVRMEVGFHYIRLTVTNDNIRDLNSDQCGLISGNVPLFDFVEFEIEVRD